MKLCERLIELKESRNLLQKDVANAVGLSLRSYQRYEYGERNPDSDKLIALANYFNVPLDFLVGRVTKFSKGAVHMDFADIQEVVETINPKDVNKYISLGWQLLEIAKGIGNAEFGEGSYLLYCLGWNKNLGEAVHPKEDVVTIDDTDDSFLPF